MPRKAATAAVCVSAATEKVALALVPRKLPGTPRWRRWEPNQEASIAREQIDCFISSGKISPFFCSSLASRLCISYLEDLTLCQLKCPSAEVSRAFTVFFFRSTYHC